MITKQGDKEPNDKMYHTRARVHTKHTANRRTDKRTHEKQMAEFDDHQLFAGIFITNLCFWSQSQFKQQAQARATNPNQTKPNQLMAVWNRTLNQKPETEPEI